MNGIIAEVIMNGVTPAHIMMMVATTELERFANDEVKAQYEGFNLTDDDLCGECELGLIFVCEKGARVSLLVVSGLGDCSQIDLITATGELVRIS